MKTNVATILMILIGILGFIIGYSMAPRDAATLQHGSAPTATAAPKSGGGGYGGGSATPAPAAGGYGGGAAPAKSGGYGH
jgi:hypothetical protein